ncbi:MAG: type IV pilus assembly protein PilM [Patescibacteria group bacterium]|nr:type IV pilus assembly protein PilM [Patescibacteria group bacterium]MCL5224377.1 type IV pilus assembly protein PilM [Patescibacteria group bacterium]
MFNVFKPLTSLVSHKSYLGVDIGTTSIKVVELSDASEKPTLRNYGVLESYGHLERLNNAIQTPTLKMLDRETADLLMTLVKQLNLKTVDAVASLPSFTAFMAPLEMPVMSSQETVQAMQYQARQFVPLPISEITLDWIPVGEYTNEKGSKMQRFFLISVPNEQIRKYQRIFKAAGLNLIALEVEDLSLARILTSGDPTLTLIVDIGARSTAIMVAKNGILKGSGQTDFAGGSLTQAVSGGLGINVRRAEELKKQRGLMGSGGEYELSTLMLPFLDVILSEVKRVRDDYEKTYREKIERIIVSGGGANLLGIEKYMGDAFGLPVAKADPFSKIISPPEVAPLVSELGPPFSVAIGLGIRQFI